MHRWLFPILLLAMSLGVVTYYAVAIFDFSPNTTDPHDAQREYQLYKSVVDGKPMTLNKDNTLVGALLTTWLPALVQKVTHIDPATLYRYFSIPLVVWLPLVVYFLVKHYLSAFMAFLVGLLFISQPYYIVAPSVARIVVATTLFALGVLVVVNERWGLWRKGILLVVLSGLMVVSHCGTAVAVVAFLIGWLTLSFVLRGHWQAVSSKQILTIGMFAVILGLVSWFWFGYAAHFLGTHVARVSTGIIAGKVPATVTGSVGIAQTIMGSNFGGLDIIHKLEMIGTWLLFAAIGAGFVMQREKHYLFLSAAVVGIALVALALVSPWLNGYYGIQRVYFHFSFLLLPFAVYGLMWLSKTARIWQWTLPTVLTVFYFVFSVAGHFIGG